MKRWLLSLFGWCPHRRGWPARDLETGLDYQPCVDCGQRLPLDVQFPRTLPLPETPIRTGIEKVAAASVAERVQPLHIRRKEPR